jgi:hypothetical protein
MAIARSSEQAYLLKVYKCRSIAIAAKELES